MTITASEFRFISDLVRTNAERGVHDDEYELAEELQRFLREQGGQT